MLRIGNMNPLSMKAGAVKKNVDSMACCCVPEMVEMKRPAPSVVNRNRIAQPKSSARLPCSGVRKISSAAQITRITSNSPMMANGSVLPRMISIGRMGVTSSCSMVPSSFSRTIACAVRDRVTIMMMFTTTPGMK
jgi:hypothetical protein